MAECEWAILCDYAFLDVNRKICLIGAFSRIAARAVPVNHPQAALAFKLTGEPKESVRFRLELVRPITAGGGLLTKFEGAQELGSEGVKEITVQLIGLMLPDWGHYSFNIHINDELSRASTFTVIPMPPELERQLPPGSA